MARVVKKAAANYKTVILQSKGVLFPAIKIKVPA